MSDDKAIWESCHFEGNAPKGYSSWSDFCSSSVKEGAALCSIETWNKHLAALAEWKSCDMAKIIEMLKTENQKICDDSKERALTVIALTARIKELEGALEKIRDYEYTDDNIFDAEQVLHEIAKAALKETGDEG